MIYQPLLQNDKFHAAYECAVGTTTSRFIGIVSFFILFANDCCFPFSSFGYSGGMDAACYNERGTKDFCYTYFICIFFYYIF
jgi:hypothetical protein